MTGVGSQILVISVSRMLKACGVVVEGSVTRVSDGRYISVSLTPVVSAHTSTNPRQIFTISKTVDGDCDMN